MEHSTHHVLIRLVDKVYKPLDVGDMMIEVVLDPRTVLDYVDHSTLLCKLFS